MILDAYAVLALLGEEPAAERVAELLRVHPCLLPATGLAEVVDRASRLYGKDPDDVAVALRHLRLLDTAEIDTAVALLAGRLRALHYHRTTRTVSLADSFVAALARLRGLPVATSDPHLLDLCQSEGIPVEPLPGSDGSVWTPR